MISPLIRGWVYLSLAGLILIAFMWWVEFGDSDNNTIAPKPSPVLPSVVDPKPEEEQSSEPVGENTETEPVGVGTETDSAETDVQPAPADTIPPEREEEQTPEQTPVRETRPEPEPVPSREETDPGPAGFCSPINGRNLNDFLTAGKNDGRGGKDIRIADGAAIRAVVSGTVVKVFQSPYTGTSLYLIGRNAEWSFLYGRFDELAEGIENGAYVKCGDVLGYMPIQGGSLHMELRRIQWWDSEPMPLETILERE